jgi:hypothetical protein
VHKDSVVAICYLVGNNDEEHIVSAGFLFLGENRNELKMENENRTSGEKRNTYDQLMEMVKNDAKEKFDWINYDGVLQYLNYAWNCRYSRAQPSSTDTVIFIFFYTVYFFVMFF